METCIVDSSIYKMVPELLHDTEKIIILLSLCEGDPRAIGVFPHKATAIWSVDVSFEIELLNKRPRYL